MSDKQEAESVEYIHAHEEIIEKVNQVMPDEEILYDLAELFKIFGDSTRIKILYVLSESEMCVYDIAQLLHMTHSAISHQLRALKQSKLVKIPPGRENGLLFIGGRSCADYYRAGDGTCYGMNKLREDEDYEKTVSND
jgi:DNA-binding transcriptional ArsR family regulator